MSTVNKQLAAICVLFCSLKAMAQIPTGIVQEQWTSQQQVQTIDTAYANESAVVLLEKKRVEFFDEKDDLVLYKTFHRRVHINDDKGIESYNRVYLPVSNNDDIVDIRARTILPNGRIIMVDKKNIKDLKEDDQLYKIFAMEGLEKGCEVEFYYTYKANISFFGKEVLQGPFPVLDAQLELVAPDRLVFETKIYNGEGTTTDTIYNGKRFIHVQVKQIAGAQDEKYASLKYNMKRVEYRLSYNKSKSASERLFTWNELAKRAYAAYTNYTDKEMKKVDGLIKSNKWASNGNAEQTVVAIEHYLKKNISTREDIDADEAASLEFIIKNKIASHRGIMRLYGAIFNKLGITHEFVMCGSREDYTVDKTFENWANCDNELIYFPTLKKYMAPTLLEMRYPFINPLWTNTMGIFCKGTTIGNFTTAIADIHTIAGEDFTKNSLNIEAKVKLNASLDTLVVSSRQLLSGYSAVNYRAMFNFSSEDYQKQMLKEMVKFGTNSEHVISSKILNREMENYQENKPFILDVVVNASELVERAGNKILVKIGEIIGPQAEMYQEKPRQFDMDVAYPHALVRTIEFEIPEGYRVKNLNDLVISRVHRDGDRTTMGFESSYKQEGNVIKIRVVEEYRDVQYPLEWYDEFRKVINAAADFNKVTLVLEKG